MRAKTILITAALGAGLLLSGCGAADSGDKSASSGSGPQRNADAAAGGVAAPAQAVPDGATAQDQKADAPDLGIDQRSIIYRGSISVRVKNVNAAAGESSGIATTAGGFIGSDERSTGGNGKDTATITLRVPAPKFSSVVDQLAKLGDEQQRQISTEDVTEQTVDLDARISVQQARVDSGRKLLAQAKTLADLVMLEKEVATRESDLASLQAKKRNLADLTALSTITVTMYEQDAPPPPAKAADKPGFLTGLSAGWHALLASLRVVLTILGALLPWAIIIGVPAWFLLRLFRRYRGPRQVALVGGPGLPAGWRVPDSSSRPESAQPRSDQSQADQSQADQSQPDQPQAAAAAVPVAHEPPDGSAGTPAHRSGGGSEGERG